MVNHLCHKLGNLPTILICNCGSRLRLMLKLSLLAIVQNLMTQQSLTESLKSVKMIPKRIRRRAFRWPRWLRRFWRILWKTGSWTKLRTWCSNSKKSNKSKPVENHSKLLFPYFITCCKITVILECSGGLRDRTVLWYPKTQDWTTCSDPLTFKTSREAKRSSWRRSTSSRILTTRKPANRDTWAASVATPTVLDSRRKWRKPAVGSLQLTRGPTTIRSRAT